MSQNDFNLANQGFPSMRADMNSALRALASNSSGATSPATTYAYQWWYDDANDILKFRNGDNDAWIDFASFNQATDSWFIPSVDITGGTIDGTVIGGSNPSAGAFTSLTLDGVPVIADLASQAQAEAGTDNETLMTPLRVKQSVNANASSGYTDAQARAAQAGHASGSVGSYIVAWNNTTSNINLGGTTAGSNLRVNDSSTAVGTNPFNVASNIEPPVSLAGTWRALVFSRAMVTSVFGDFNEFTSLTRFPSFFLRIS